MRIEMPEKRKKHDREFREGAVRIVEETNKPIAQVARGLGVNEGTLGKIRAAVRRWVNADRPGPKATGDTAHIVDLMLASGCRIGEILALRWSDLDLDGGLPTLTVTGTIKAETGKGTYPKSTPKSDASQRTVVLPPFAAELLRVRREFATPNGHDAVFATRNGTWHQVVNVERRWRQIRKDTGYEWVTPHTRSARRWRP
jgi:integrase